MTHMRTHRRRRRRWSPPLGRSRSPAPWCLVAPTNYGRVVGSVTPQTHTDTHAHPYTLHAQPHTHDIRNKQATAKTHVAVKKACLHTFSQPHTHTHAHLYTHTNTSIHTYMHTIIQVRTQTPIHTYMHTHPHTHTHAHMRARTHNAHPYTHARAHSHTHPHMLHTQKRKHTHQYGSLIQVGVYKSCSVSFLKLRTGLQHRNSCRTATHMQTACTHPKHRMLRHWPGHSPLMQAKQKGGL